MALARSLAKRPVRTAVALAARDRETLKTLTVTGTLAGRSAEEVHTLGERFAAEVCAGWLRADTVRTLRRHQDEGASTVIVTASLSVYADAIGRILGVHAVLATRLEVDEDGLFTGALVGGNCRGAEKVERLRSWAAAAGLRGVPLSHAYGDSAGDARLLAVAENPHRVDRRAWEKVPSP
jgi:phosphatidylglycerophosphatase C